MKIQISESTDVESFDSVRVIDESGLNRLLLNLLSADSDEDYKLSSIELREFVRPKDGNEAYYKCINPEWFDNKVSPEVDNTTCSFCGYRTKCLIGVEDNDHFEIIKIGDIQIPSSKILQQKVLFPEKSTSPINRDPFFGFSSRAGKTRNLFLISQGNFDGFFPNNTPNNLNYNASIGYDRYSNTSIWPIDLRFLQIYEQMKNDIKIELKNYVKYVEVAHSDFCHQDKKALLNVAVQKGWIDDRGDTTRFDDLQLLCHRLISVLQSDRIHGKFDSLLNLHMTPDLDIPLSISGSGFINLAIRWIELRFGDILEYIEQFGEIEPEHATSLRESFHSESIGNYSGKISVIPRFPAIAIAPSSKIKDISLEQAACRIIDVVEHECSEILLLIDPLGIDMYGVM